MSVTTCSPPDARPTGTNPTKDGVLRLEVLSPLERSFSLRAWRELESRLESRRLACSADWTETWLRHYGGLVPHRFAVARRDGQVVGMALLTSGQEQQAGPFALRTWHVGTAGERDVDSVCIEYNTLLVGDEDRVAFAEALWQWSDRQADSDEMRLDGFAAHEVDALLQRHPTIHVARKLSRYFDLKAAREEGVETLAKLSGNTRSHIRRSLKQLNHPQGEWVESAADAEAAMLTMIDLHQARWTALGEPGSYASQPFREFHLDLLHRLVPSGRMKLFRVTSGTQVVGISQMLIDNNRVLLYQGGWSPGSGSVSPGLATDYLCLVESLKRGYDAYDFLAGDSTHKQRMTTHAAELVWAVWRRPRLKYAVLDTLRTIKRLLQRLEESDAPASTSCTNSSTSATAPHSEGH